MTQLSPSQLRRHALLLRERAPNYKRPEDEAMAQAEADLLDAEADVADAKAGTQSGIADSAIISREYPILGRIDTEGGAIKHVEHPFGESEINTLAAKGIHVAWEWSFDPASGLDEGRLYRIYVGSEGDGPRASWYNGRWRRLRSNGNYGKRYAFGGTWSSDKTTYGSLAEADPELAVIIKSEIGRC